MHDYEPIDLADVCNSGADVLGECSDVTLGSMTLRGLPFLLGGGADENRVVVAGGPNGPVRVPIGKAAHRVIVAHRLLEVPVDAPTGTRVAEYVFRFAGGGEERVAIREQFEIGTPQSVRGTYNAVGNEYTSLQPRYQGDFGRAGARQMEGAAGGGLSFTLWTWESPHPGETVESLEIIPDGASIVVGGLTVGYVDEHPFARQGRRPVRIDLKHREAADRPFDLEVSVDRGDATYPYALPEQSTDEFVQDRFKGWGEAQNTSSSPSYVEISAVPSATVSVTQGGQPVADASWGEMQDKGAADTPAARFQLLDRGKNWVHVTVVDDDTGKPVPCRVHFRSPEGVPYQPYGHHNHVNSNLDTFHVDIGGDLRLGQITYAYIDGTCQGWLPRGDVIVDVARGFEYEPLRTAVTIEPGQRELSLRLKRWTDMNAQGWYSGDSHVHFVGAQGAHREAQGEDLDVVNLLQSQWGSLFTNAEDFTGRPSVSENGESIVYVGQENRQHFYGHLILWGLKRPVMPWCTGEFGEAEIGGTMEATLSDWVDQARAQGATAVAPHFAGLNGETAALVATDRLSGVEMHRQSENMHWEYYRSLNAGYRLPLLGGTDKMYSDVPVGMYRTYVKMRDGEEFSYRSWCDNVARGRTFHSGGAIIHMTVDGHEIGDTVGMSGPGTVEVEAWAESVLPLYTLQIVHNGEVIASADSATGTRRLEIRERVKIDGHSWLAARCGGPDYFAPTNLSASKVPSWSDRASARKDVPGTHYDGWRRGVFAHTSPIYVACGGDWWMFNEATARHMLTVFEGDLTFMRNVVHQHEPGTVTHHHGEDDHLAYLSRPFLEARDAVLKRMKERGITG
jgi:hypothetical protein